MRWALKQEDLATARAHGEASLILAREIGDLEQVAFTLATLAGLAAAHRDPERALQLAGAALSIREAIGKSSPARWWARFERRLEPARRALHAEAGAAAEAAGPALSLETAMALALAPHDEPADSAAGEQPSTSEEVQSPPEAPRPAVVTSLSTRRELEVAALIARGLTNRQIAGELVIAEGTVANHVKNILARHGLDTRLQIAAWTIERGLHLHAPA